MADNQELQNHLPGQQTEHSTGGDRRGPGVRVPPPLVFLGFLAAGLGLQLIWPWGITDSLLLLYGGVTLCALAIIGLLGTGLMFHRHKTSIEPWKPTTRVLDHGPYAYSRNPIYVAFCFLAIGIGLSQNSLWMTLSFIPSVFVVFHTAIAKEEKYLEKKFGEEYRRYKEKVRRWL
ncbi:MAG: isoprenylcysteine carboxylmethyltransferase family protein [Gammaproteobacteria bacterium]|jgi:protein-S-isoprenylcysteine O-methyltransferase Ste14